MQVEYTIKLGQDEFKLIANVENEIEFFSKLSFYSSLPKTGPGGETDLKISHRTTKEGHNYYSLVSELAGQEFRFGLLTAKNGGGLYPKGWAPIYRGDGQAEQTGTTNVSSVGQTGGITAAQVTTAEQSSETNPVDARPAARSTTGNSSSLRRNTTTAAPASVTSSAGDLINRYATVKTDAQPTAKSSLLRR